MIFIADTIEIDSHPSLGTDIVKNSGKKLILRSIADPNLPPTLTPITPQIEPQINNISVEAQTLAAASKELFDHISKK